MEIEPDEPTAFGNRIELIVGQVAGGWADRMSVGMGSDERCFGDAGDIPKTLFRQVGKVDLNIERVAGPDERLSSALKSVSIASAPSI